MTLHIIQRSGPSLTVAYVADYPNTLFISNDTFLLSIYIHHPHRQHLTNFSLYYHTVAQPSLTEISQLLLKFPWMFHDYDLWRTMSKRSMPRFSEKITRGSVSTHNFQVVHHRSTASDKHCSKISQETLLNCVSN
jgi:hypothetical protein